jgi:hypothetical protein
MRQQKTKRLKPEVIVPIVVALIALIGVISAAFIGNIDKWSSKVATNSNTISNSNIIVSTPYPTIGSANNANMPPSQNRSPNINSNSKETMPLVTAETTTQKPIAMSPYFRELYGKLVYSNGSEQTFAGFRCLYSNRLYYSQNLESLSTDSYRSASSINLVQVVRIDFSERPNINVRRGIARLRNGKILEKMFFYVEECSWWEEPDIEGRLNDPTIAALVITGVPGR